MKQLELFEETPVFEDRRVDGLPGQYVWFLDVRVAGRNTTWLHMKEIKGIRKTTDTTWTKTGKKSVKDGLVIEWVSGGSTDISKKLNRIPKDEAVEQIEAVFSKGHCGEKKQGWYETVLSTIRMTEDPMIFKR